MNRYYLIIIFCCFKGYTQKFCGKIMYKETSNLDMYYQTISISKFNRDTCYTNFLHYKKAKPFLNKVNSKLNYNDDTKIEVIDTDNEETKMFFHTNKETYFTHYLHNPERLIPVKEDKFNWNWKITDETKKIGSFTCTKAMISFRGRKFIAWFTPEIPVSFGPMKFKGLPGLILKVYDSTKKWHTIALKVEIENQKDCNINFDKEIIKNSRSIKEYLVEWNNDLILGIKKSLARQGQGTKNINLDRCFACNRKVDLEIFTKIPE